MKRSASKKGGETKKNLTYNVGIIGSGAPLISFLRMIKYNEIDYLKLNTCAVCLMDDETEIPEELITEQTKIYKGKYEKIFKAGDINSLVDLTGDRDVIKTITRLRPSGVPIVNKVAAEVMLAMFDTSSAKMRSEHMLRKELNRERQRIKQLFNSLPDSIMVTDRDLVITDVNDEFLNVNKTSEEDVIGKKCHDVQKLHRNPCHEHHNKCPLAEVVETRKPKRFVHQVSGKDGKTIYSSVTISPILGENGDITGLIEASRDITSQIKLEEELLQSKIRLDKFIEAAPFSIAIKNLEGQYIQINRRGCKDIGLSFEDIITKTDFEIQEEANAKIITSNDQIVTDGNRDLTVEERLFRKKEIRFYNTIRFPIYSSENSPVAVCVIAQDVTELKGAQLDLEIKQRELETTKEYLQNILENPSSIIITTDMEHKVVSFNRGAEILTGYSREESVGSHISFLYKSSKIHDQLLKKMKKQKGYVSEEIQIVKKDKSVLEADTTISELQDNSGTPIGMVGVFHDISMRKQVQQQLIRTDRLDAVGKLGAGMAHEINNPTAVVMEAVGLAAELAESDPGIRFSRSFNELMSALNVVKQQARRISEITGRLLGFASQSERYTEEVNVNSVIKEVLTFTFDYKNYSNITVKTELLEEIPRLFISSFQLQQVLANIIDNSIDAIGDGKGIIKVKTSVQGTDAIIEICDDGAGIPQEYLDRIFDPFITTKPVGKGTGLGLSICYGIINQMGGKIDVESRQGEGACFKISLPVKIRNNKD